MATILVRQNLNQNTTNDPAWGNSLGNFLSDIYAVAQICDTTLRLWTGELWSNLIAGVPYLPNSYNNGPSILGYANAQTSAASAILQQALLGVPYVTGLVGVETAYDQSSRYFIFACVINTVFGPLSVATAPGLSASLVVANSSTNLLTG